MRGVAPNLDPLVWPGKTRFGLVSGKRETTHGALIRLNHPQERFANKPKQQTGRQLFHQVLAGGLWHVTSPDRFASILRDGAILPNPRIADSERWGTARGSAGYPYVRSISGVSLFDFLNFDENSYSEAYPVSNWAAFVPCPREWPEAVWIELHRHLLGDRLIDGPKLLRQWKAERSSRRFMPLIEAAHVGPIPVSMFRRALIYRSGQWCPAHVNLVQ